jgi:heat shock protein HslJ
MNHLMKIWKRPGSLFLLVALLVACSGASEDEAAEVLESPDHLHGTAWLVTAYQDSSGELVDVLDGTEITASFSQERADGGTTYGFTSCNDYHGDYNVSPENNVWPGINLELDSQNTCSDEIMEQGQAFITDGVQRRNRIRGRRCAGRLRLHGRSGCVR